MTVYVSMLRAVNVGGNSGSRWTRCVRCTSRLGLADVRTLLQSGNVLFRSSLTDRQQLVTAHRAGDRAAARPQGRSDSAHARRGREHRRARPRALAARRQEQAARDVPESVPDAAAQAALLKWHKAKDDEMVEMRGPEIYLYYPDGIGRSKLTSAVIEDKLDTAGTARNWNTLDEAASKPDGRSSAPTRCAGSSASVAGPTSADIAPRRVRQPAYSRSSSLPGQRLARPARTRRSRHACTA